MSLKLNDINGAASEWAYGFKATSRSIKPVHIAQVIFSHTLDESYAPETLFKFAEKPSKTPSSELPDEIRNKFEISTREKDEDLDRLRRTMRKVLDNDNAMYASQRGSAPTCTSDWFILNPMTGVTVGRFVYHLISETEGNIERKLQTQLSDHHDSISLLFRPLVIDEEPTSPSIKPWQEPDADDPLEDGKIASDLRDGFETLGKHLKEKQGISLNYPRDLRRIVKFAGVAFYLYVANRHNELRTDGNDRSTRLPIVLNYTGERNNPVAKASLDCFDTVATEVQATTRLGVEKILDQRGYKDDSEYSETKILEKIESQELLELSRNKQSKIDDDYETFKYIFEGDPAEDTFDRLVNTVSDAIHQSRYKTYTPVDTVQTFGWRIGLLKPRGNRANERRFRPDPEVLEPIVLSVLSPDESISLQELCERLRERYGVIVGGTNSDRSQLSEWGVKMGSSTTESDPLSNRNKERFKQAVIDLGYAREYADGVTIVSADDR
jgi:hypothetical protein